ncbi:MAG: lysozyme [Comamonadaceae bacterium]|nr:MAG: lysozyme [Comamonadaceae bacterium]
MPAVLRSKLLAVALSAAAAGTGTYVATHRETLASPAVQLAQEIGSHYESSGRHIGTPYIDRVGRGQPLTVCDGITGPEVVAGRNYTREDCKRLELPRYRDAERAAKRLFIWWAVYNVWVQASIIDMIFNVGEAQVATSTMLRMANEGDLPGACAQMTRWVNGTVNGQRVRLAGLVDRTGTRAELCADWGRDGHFSAAGVAP